MSSSSSSLLLSFAVVCLLSPSPASKVGSKLQGRNLVAQLEECDVRLSENQLRYVPSAAGGRADVPESLQKVFTSLLLPLHLR